MNLAEKTEDTCSKTHSLLAFLQQQLESGAAEPLVDILGGLAKAFAVDAAGLGVLLEESANHVTLAMAQAAWVRAIPEHLPWEKDGALLSRVKEQGKVIELAAQGQHWLLAPVRQASATWVLWLNFRQHRNWSMADKSCLALAGECLVQRFVAGPEGSQWLTRKLRLQMQEGINRTAAVTRRLTHDFCNILTSISGFAELALLNMPANSPAHRFAAEVLESARQGARWSQKLQVFSLDRPQRFLPTSLITMLVDEQLRPDWHRKIALKVDLPPQLPSVALEPESLRQVLNAILDNAREAIDGQGVVTVAARSMMLSAGACLELLGKPRPGAHVELTITDTGSGMTPDVRNRLFRDMFFSSKGRRRGLGLASVYGIMQSYHGGFRLDPAGDRSGTTVRMYLPLAERPPMDAPVDSNKEMISCNR